MESEGETLCKMIADKGLQTRGPEIFNSPHSFQPFKNLLIFIGYRQRQHQFDAGATPASLNIPMTSCFELPAYDFGGNRSD